MMTTQLILTILFFHWVFDFVMQTDWQAKNKSVSNTALLDHTTAYAMLWFPVILTLLNFKAALCFMGITWITHTITDYFTSRLNTSLHKKGKIHEFFVSVGFDQWLHYVQLFLTYQLLEKL